MPTMSRTCVMRPIAGFLCLITAMTAPALGCDISFPKDYVPPTKESFVAHAQVVFEGKVIGLRTDSGEIIAQDYDCDAVEDGCWEKRLTVNTAILSVDHAIRGIEEGRLMEVDRSPDPAANCGQGYEGGAHYLFTDGNTTKLESEPDAEQLRQWAAIPYVSMKSTPAEPLDILRPCLVYVPTPDELVEDIRTSNQALVGTVVGFRMDDTRLLTELPYCPLRGDDGASSECVAFWDHVVSTQFKVEASIKGVDDQPIYEMKVFGRDKCLAFDIGERWLTIGDYYYGNIRFDEMPSSAMIAGLRRGAEGQN